MSNASKKTDEELLQNTFQNFKTQEDTEEPDTSNDDSDSPKKAGGKKNMNAIIGVGAVAVVLVGYIFLKPMLLSKPVQQVQNKPAVNVAVNQPSNQGSQGQPDVNISVGQPMPNPNQPIQPSVPAVIPSVIPTPNQPAQTVDPLAQLNAGLSNQGQNNPNAQGSQGVAPVDKFFNETTQAGQPSVPSVNVGVGVPNGSNGINNGINISANPNGSTIVTPTAANTTSDVVVSDLQMRMESQNNEMRSMLNGIDSRVGILESKLNEQSNLNDQVDKRLVALENGKVDKRSSEVKNVTTNSATPKPVRKAAPVVKKAEVKQDKELVIQDANILVDKGGVKPVVQAPKKVAPESENLAPVKIHSIYGKRIWTSNSNGTLSTYTEGDKLPTGEVIKTINDNNFTVVTNLRKIVKN